MITVKVVGVKVDRPNTVQYDVELLENSVVLSREGIVYDFNVVVSMNDTAILNKLAASFRNWDKINRPETVGAQAPFDQLIGQEINI